MKKKFKKKCFSDLPTLIFSRYETGTTGIFLGLSHALNNIFLQIPMLSQFPQATLADLNMIDNRNKNPINGHNRLYTLKIKYTVLTSIYKLFFK
jgi:hypothetical protein